MQERAKGPVFAGVEMELGRTGGDGHAARPLQGRVEAGVEEKEVDYFLLWTRAWLSLCCHSCYRNPTNSRTVNSNLTFQVIMKVYLLKLENRHFP